MKITWLTQGAFLFESGGTRLVVDPYMSDFLELNHKLTRLTPFPLTKQELRPDWLFCTHNHLDHLDPQTVEELGRMYPACRFAGPQSCYDHFQKLGIEAARCTLAQIGTPLACGAFNLLPVPAFHSDPCAVGVIIEAEGKRIYLSGDSNYAPELVSDATRGCDAVFLCVNGKLGNMSLEDAVRVVEAIRPRAALPMHYGLFAENTVDPAPFVKQCIERGVQSFLMQSGKEFVL